MSEKEIEEGKVCAILSYLLIGIIWYFADEKMKNNSFARFHAQQGLVLLISGVAVSIIATILFRVPFTNWIIILLELCLFVLWLLGIINAATGKKNALPVIGSFGEKLKI
ncbi:MAG: hypothetical protein QXG86_01385 [Candidatus Woesearchaeota archaeon]